MSATVTKSGPGLVSLKEKLEKISKSDVLVGIPADRTMRKGDKMNNATLLWILSKGSEIVPYPPRPVLEPAIAANNKLISPPLALAAKATLENDPITAEKQLNRAGMIAANAAKRWFTDPRNHWPPNAPSTIANKGSDRPLINTGALRGSITHAVRVDGKSTTSKDFFKHIKSIEVEKPEEAEVEAPEGPPAV